jgi:hypothetical protein
MRTWVTYEFSRKYLSLNVNCLEHQLLKDFHPVATLECKVPVHAARKRAAFEFLSITYSSLYRP